MSAGAGGVRQRTAGRLRLLRRLSLALAAGTFAAFARLAATSSHHARSTSHGSSGCERVEHQAPADDDDFFETPAPGTLGGSTDTPPVGQSGGS